MKRRAVSAVLATVFLAVMLLSVPFRGAAASATVDMGYSPSAPKVGDSVTVSVVCKADEAIGVVEAYLVYDPDYLEFVSGDSASGGGGSINIIGVGSTNTKTLTYNLTFNCLQAGTGNVQVTSSNIIAYTSEQSIGGGVAYCYVEIGGGQSSSSSGSSRGVSNRFSCTGPSSLASWAGIR